MLVTSNWYKSNPIRSKQSSPWSSSRSSTALRTPWWSPLGCSLEIIIIIIMISPYPACDSLCRGPSPKWGIATSGMWRGSWASSSLQMSHSPLRTCTSIPLNGLGNWSAIPGEHEDGLKLCERRVMRAMLSWNVVTANETDKLRQADVFDIIISFASAFILASFKSKEEEKQE